MRIFGALAAAAVLQLFLTLPAHAGFVCAKPTVAQALTDQDKQAIFDINAKIHDMKVQHGADYLGAQDGIMCNAPDGKGKFWHFAHGSVYWSPGTGAHAVVGLIKQKWAQMGWEQGALGYPMSDEIDTYDGKAKVSKFQGGQLTWRPWTNAVTAAMTTDLLVDLPSPAGKAWYVVQANGYKLDDPATPDVNEADSHGGPWVYCYDLVSNTQGETKGANYLASADARIVQVIQGNGNDDQNNANIIIQFLGRGRYASSLHVQTNSYANTFGKNKPAVLLSTPWADRPIAKSGDPIATVGKTGTQGEHIHYCITTAPDGTAFKPFESVPFAFRNYEVATNAAATTWKTVASGRPERGSIIRRKVSSTGGPANVKATGDKDLLNFGTVKGTITAPAGAPMTGSKITVTVRSGWGEPLATATLVTNAAGQAAYALSVPDFPVTVEAQVTATANPEVAGLKGSGPATIEANKTSTVNIAMTK